MQTPFETVESLIEQLETFIPTLPERFRRTVCANYYKNGHVSVGFDVDGKAEETLITSATSRSPVMNVVSRLTK